MGLVLFLVIGLFVVIAFMHVLEELANERRSASSGRQKGIRSCSEDTITYSGNG